MPPLLSPNFYLDRPVLVFSLTLSSLGLLLVLRELAKCFRGTGGDRGRVRGAPLA